MEWRQKIDSWQKKTKGPRKSKERKSKTEDPGARKKKKWRKSTELRNGEKKEDRGQN